MAFIQLRPEFSDLSVDALHSWCQENMATYKVPQIRLIDEFPLTTTGKVKKEVLKKEFLKGSAMDPAGKDVGQCQNPAAGRWPG